MNKSEPSADTKNNWMSSVKNKLKERYHRYRESNQPEVDPKHVKLLRLTRSCMCLIPEAIDFGLRFSEDDGVSNRRFTHELAKIETCGIKVPCQSYELKHSKYYRTYISEKHCAFTAFPNVPKEKDLTIVFRQSFCANNWLMNMQWIPRSEDGIHTGFYTISQSLLFTTSFTIHV